MTCALDNPSKGTCKPYASDTDPEKDCLGKDPDCGGKCDGAGKCDFPLATKTCGAGKCMACDGTGQCNRPPKDDSSCGTIDCDKLDTKCRDYHDLTTERCDSFSKCKPANDPKTCTLYTDLVCGDAAVPDQGQSKEAGPSADQGGQEPAPNDTGCGCRTAGGPDSSGLMLLVLLGWVARCRRRSRHPG